MTNDPIADLLTRVRNAAVRKHENVSAPYSRAKEQIVKILKATGYIENFAIVNDNQHKNITILLKYDERGDSQIQSLKRVSKPGLRVYSNYKKLPNVLNGLGIAIVSTPKGIMTAQEARKSKIGGEIICTIY